MKICEKQSYKLGIIKFIFYIFNGVDYLKIRISTPKVLECVIKRMLIKITDEPATDFFEIDCDELEFPNLIKIELTEECDYEITEEDEEEEEKKNVRETVKFIQDNLKVHYTYKTVSKNKRLKKLLDDFENYNYEEYTKLSLVFWGSNKSYLYGIRENKIRLKEVIIEWYNV